MASDFTSNDQSSSNNVPPPVDPISVPNEEDESWNVDNWNNEVYKFEQKSLIKNKLGLIVNKRYEIVQRIDAGAFGSTYIGEDLKNNHQRVAVKFDTGKSEWKKTKKDENHLKYEFEVYKSTLYDDGVEEVHGFAQVYWFGFQYGHNILVMELLGASVASLFTFCDRKFGWQTVLSLAQQMISRIRHIHQRGFIHRDTKPENFLMGLGNKETTCYLIDFGLARRYRFRHPEDRQLKHIPFRRGRSFIGTAKYASINSHRSVELSRRDDLESIGYVLIELINGHLPWRNICRRNQNNKHQTYMRIRSAKEQANWIEICPPMAEYMRYCRELQFPEEPNYDKILSLLRTRLIEEQQSTQLPKSIQMKCETCRANETKDIRPKIERIEEENSPLTSPPSEPLLSYDFNNVNGQNSTISQPNATYPLLGNDSDKLAHQLNSVKLSDGFMNGSPHFYPKRHYFAPPIPITSSTKMSQSTVDNFSQNSSLENLKSNLSANLDLSVKKAGSEVATEEDADSVKSCQNCRQQKQTYFDDEFIGGGDSKLSWQIWRDSTPENRLDFEHKFSWTLPVAPKPNHFPFQHQHSYYPPPLNFSQPPPIHPTLINPSIPPPNVPFHPYPQQAYLPPPRQFGPSIGFGHPNNPTNYNNHNINGYPSMPPFYQNRPLEPHHQQFYPPNTPFFCIFQPPKYGPFVPT